MSTPTPADSRLAFLSLALRLSCATNLFAATWALALPVSHAHLFYQAVPQEGVALLNHQLLWSFVGIMGLAYGFAAKQPTYHRAILLAGGFGKLVATGLWVRAYAAGLATPWLLAAGATDSALGIAFLVGLWRMRAIAPVCLPFRQDSKEQVL